MIKRCLTLAFSLAISSTALGLTVRLDRIPGAKAGDRIEISSDASFAAGTAVHSGKLSINGDYRWQGAAQDRVYHWRLQGRGTSSGSFAVIGRGKGYATLTWEDAPIAKGSYDLETVTSNGGIAIERLSQNWSSRRRGKYDQVLFLTVTGVDRSTVAGATHFPTLELVLGQEAEPLTIAPKPAIPVVVAADKPKTKPANKDLQTAGSTTKPVVQPPPSTSAKPQAAKASAPLLINVRSERRIDRPADAEGRPGWQVQTLIGAGLSHSQRSKQEIDLAASHPVFVGGFLVEGAVWRRLRTSIEYTRRMNEGVATIESEFDLPEVSLPKTQQDLGLSAKWAFGSVTGAQFDLGLVVHHCDSWGLPLAYSSLDGGALFAKQQNLLYGPTVEGFFPLSTAAFVEMKGLIETTESSSVQSLQRAALGLGWRYRWNRSIDSGVHAEQKWSRSKRCHRDSVICEREGFIQENEATTSAALSVGYQFNPR